MSFPALVSPPYQIQGTRFLYFKQGVLRAARQGASAVDESPGAEERFAPKLHFSEEELKAHAARLRSAIRAEKSRGRNKHRSYDLTRHLRLVHAYRATMAALSALPPALDRKEQKKGPP